VLEKRIYATSIYRERGSAYNKNTVGVSKINKKRKQDPGEHRAAESYWMNSGIP